MKIYHYQRRDHLPNFGDELNLWLWPQLLPNFFDQDASCLFIGTGTLLNNHLPDRIKSADQVIIMGTGAGYEQPLTSIPAHWQIYCVRGPLSAQRLALPPTKAIADGGILVERVFANNLQPSFAVSLMPHIHHANYAPELWQTICQQTGINYIDPCWPIDRVLTAISQSRLLLAEAMHGAIVADALRVPWIPIVTSPRILAFKWQDWCQSVDLTYHPQVLPPLHAYPRWSQGLRSGFQSLHHWQRSFRQTALTTTLYALTINLDLINQRLTHIIEHIPPNLSHAKILSRRLEQLEEQLHQVSHLKYLRSKS